MEKLALFVVVRTLVHAGLRLEERQLQVLQKNATRLIFFGRRLVLKFNLLVSVLLWKLHMEAGGVEHVLVLVIEKWILLRVGVLAVLGILVI